MGLSLSRARLTSDTALRCAGVSSKGNASDAAVTGPSANR